MESKDRVMVLSASHLKGEEEVFRGWDAGNENPEEIYLLIMTIMTRLKFEGMRVGD